VQWRLLGTVKLMRSFSILVLSCLLFTCNSESRRLTTVTLKDTQVYFGLMKVKDTIKYNFLVTNTGDNNLFIDTITTSCGCIHDTWTKLPIVPGGLGYVTVAFKPDSQEFGFVTKSVEVVTNTKRVYIPLKIMYSINSYKLKLAANAKNPK
jgi:hypothetical protein